MKFLMICWVAALMTSSCATVRVVKSQPGKGGILATKDGFIGESAKDKSEKIMRSSCPRGYSIVEEGEAVIGSSTSSSAKTKNEGSSGQLFAKESSSSGATETTQKTEWRVTYKCKK